MAASQQLPWVEKYRPTTLEEVMSHGCIIKTIEKFLEKGQLPNLLLHGPPGTGKTTTAKAIARKIFGERGRGMVLELNASDDRGINVVRQQVKTFAECLPTKVANSGGMEEFEKVKLIILDEADQMTAPAQMALRRTMEKFSDRTRFCLICNYVNKISPALQSRCSKFRFPPLDESVLKPRTMMIANLENIRLTQDGLDQVVRCSLGDMRRVLNTLQSAAMGHSGQAIDSRTILSTLGSPLPEEVYEIFRILREDTIAVAYSRIFELQTSRGYSLEDIVTAVYEASLQIDWPSLIPLTIYPDMAAIQ